MTGSSAKPPGRPAASATPAEAPRVKIVRATLADGTVREYRYAARQRRARAAGALGGLFNQYSVSPEFKRLVPETQALYLRHMAALQDELGWMTRPDLEAPAARAEFYAERDKLAETPGAADMRMAVLRSALGWAEDRGLLDVNRARRIKPLRPPAHLSPHRDKHYTREQEAEILALPQHYVDLYTVGLYTLLRRIDLCLLDSEAHFDRDGWLVIQPRKTARSTGVVLHLPVFALPPLAATIERLRRANPTGKLLRTETGIPWQPHNVSEMWRRAVLELDMDGMRFHDIRHTGNSRLAAAGCTEAERGAINGDKMATGSGQVYVARMREISLNAYRKWAAYLERQPEVVQLASVRR
jgi:integrase